jgi:hypothetical protein
LPTYIKYIQRVLALSIFFPIPTEHSVNIDNDEPDASTQAPFHSVPDPRVRPGISPKKDDGSIRVSDSGLDYFSKVLIILRLDLPQAIGVASRICLPNISDELRAL